MVVLVVKIQQAKSNKQVANSKQLDKVTFVAASAIDKPSGQMGSETLRELSALTLGELSTLTLV